MDAMQATYPLKWAADTVRKSPAWWASTARAKATVERYNGFCEAVRTRTRNSADRWCP